MSLPALGIAIYNRPDLLLACIRSVDFPVENLIVVNNGAIHALENEVFREVEKNGRIGRAIVYQPGTNLGCAGAWNLIQDHAFGTKDPHINAAHNVSHIRQPVSHVLICGNDIEWATGDLEIFWNAAVEYKTDFVFGNHSYSNFMVAKSGFETVGAFDENFWPAYLEDSSHWQVVRRSGARSIHAAGLRAVHRGSSTVNSANAHFAASIRAGHERSWDYYAARWGCPRWSGGQETFAHPFNDPNWPLSKWQLSKHRLHQPHYWGHWPI